MMLEKTSFDGECGHCQKGKTRNRNGVRFTYSVLSPDFAAGAHAARWQIVSSSLPPSHGSRRDLGRAAAAGAVSIACRREQLIQPVGGKHDGRAPGQARAIGLDGGLDQEGSGDAAGALVDAHGAV